MSKSTNPNTLYDIASKNGDKEIDFWGKVPRSLNEVVDLSISNFNLGKLRTSSDKKKLETLKKILRKYHHHLGILTPKVEEHINFLDNGSILAGQQPIVFGGPGFIANKISCLLFLFQTIKDTENPLAPVFFVGDYDGLQKELVRQYFPNPISHNAFILDSEDYLPEESNIAAHAAKLPSGDWFDEYLEKIEENLLGFKSQVKGVSKKLLEERWFHIRTILKSSFTISHTLSDWSVAIWGYLSNIVSDHGIIFLPASHPEIRKLIAPEYLKYIANSKLFVSNFHNSTKRIKKLGFEPTLPNRSEDYAPFALECSKDNNRINTKIVSKSGQLFAEGECPSCKEACSYRVTTESDLLKIATMIGPRVDSSQAVYQDLMNIRIRISGPGEIAYYAQAAPAVRAIGFEVPIFVKYKRGFYNSPWIEKLGKQLLQMNQGSLHQKELFTLLRDRRNALKEDNNIGVIQAEEKMTEFISEQYSRLVQAKESIDSMKYLGWQFGRFTPEKFGQEVSWIWFDMALQTGVTDYIDTYFRMYTKYSSLGGYYFINSFL